MKPATTYSVRKNEDQGCRFRKIEGQGIRVTLEVTGRCNLRCQHCFACADQEELETETLISIIRQLPEINTRKIILTGGEPLLRRDIELLIRTANSVGIGMDLNTNMSAFTPKRAESLWEAGLREISTSIDGTLIYHDWFRRKPGDFAKVISGIRLALSFGYDTDVHGVCTPDNLSNVNEIIDLCAHLGVSSYTLLAVVSLGRGIANLRDQRFSLTEDDKIKLRDILEVKRKQYNGNLTIRTVDIFNHPDCEECPMGIQVIGITSTGKVKPCLLADYASLENENAAEYPINTVLQRIRQRVLSEGRHLMCSNTTISQNSQL